MKFLNIITCTLGFVPSLALANVNFLTTIQSQPGKGDAANKFLAGTIADFHRIQPIGQTDLFGIRVGKEKFVVLEQYTTEEAAITWTYNATHVEACKPLGSLMDSSSVQVQSDASPQAIQKFIDFLRPPSSH